MEALLRHAPVFFAEGLSAANALAEDPRALSSLLARVSRGEHLPEGAGAALEFVIGGARRLKISDAKQVSEALTRLTPASARLAEALAQAAVSVGGGGAAAGSAGLPRLLGVDWAATVPVAGGAGSPSGVGGGGATITLQLRLDLPEGGTTTRAIHLTVAQLALLEAAVREAVLSLERA
jgi:hypothetical protein